MMQQKAPAQREHHGDRMIGDLGRAVIGHVADHDLPVGRRLAVDSVVPDPHADDAAQLGEPGEIGGADPLAQDHQTVGGGAVGIRQLGERPGVADNDGDLRPKNPPLVAIIGVVVFRVENRPGHSRHSFDTRPILRSRRGQRNRRCPRRLPRALSDLSTQGSRMNGAELLVHSLLANGVDTCFANPGTSEMHFVAALDRIPGMRCVLGLFEGVVTGAADGYARMAGKPAATLLHCGPGLANGLANLHNARRAATPIVNVVGDQATYHRPLDAPLTADTEGWARGASAWVRTATSAATVGRDAAVAVQAARTAPGQIATLILPADTAWNEGGVVGEALAVPERPHADPHQVRQAASVLRGDGTTLILLGGDALAEAGLALAHRIAAHTGASIMAMGSNRRMARGRGRVPINRIPYPVDQAVKALAGFRHVILIGCRKPVIFFAYPNKPGTPVPEGADVHTLARPEQDPIDAMARLAEELGAPAAPIQDPGAQPELARGALTPESFAQTLAALLPAQAIVADEAITFGRGFFPATFAAAPHDWLSVTGGAIGGGIPLATGAALGAPGRRVVNLQADGSAMYTIQALWTQARERLDVTTIIFSNRKYQILIGELANVGANPGRTAMDMLDLGNPDLDFVGLARAMGVEAARAESCEQFADLFAQSLRAKGPFLIELPT